VIQQQNNFLWGKLNGLSRFLLNHTVSGFLPLYIVNEYPKSGGSWLGQMLSEALQVPFPRNRLPMLRSSIMHGHYIWPGNMKNIVILWRDGRDVLVSQYYHSLFYNEKGNQRGVEITRHSVSFTDYEDICNNLPEFIEYTYKQKGNLGFSWADFYMVWGNRENVIHVQYENLRTDPAKELQRIVFALTTKKISHERATEIADKFSFEKQSGRKPGQENTKSFMRKGIVGDWINHFSPNAKKLFNEYAGNALIGLGYEKDHSWINL
jgi:hypothetical protein